MFKFSKFLFLLSVGSLSAAAQESYRLDWSKIEHWAGEGPLRAALIVQFDSSDSAEPEAAPSAYVWGYRWSQDGDRYDADKFPVCSVEKMVREVAQASRDLDVLVQRTGSTGTTLAGVGLSYDHAVIDRIEYDFDGAVNDDKVTFDWFGSNRPGSNTPVLVAEALRQARSSHIIEHPVNAIDWPQPAYDYDHWGSPDLADFLVDEVYWQSGWYDGYWSFWIGGENLRRLSYSGSGMSGVEIKDGMVAAWVYVPLDRNELVADGQIPAASLSKPLDYEHYQFETDHINTLSPETVKPEYFNLQGFKVNNPEHGLYIVRQGASVKKIKL